MYRIDSRIRTHMPSVLAAAVVASLFFATVLPSGAAERAAVLPPAALNQLYLTAYEETLQRHAFQQTDGTTYVSTGDIKAEWLRDTSAIARAYIGLAQTDPGISQMLRGVISRQAKYILTDAYANAFGADYRVVERKFELDSLLYPIWLAYLYWQRTHDGTIFTDEESLALDRVLHVMEDEQFHAERSPYRHPQLTGTGDDDDAYTGMVWTGFRPSDDPARYHYNIPDNMLAVVVLEEFAQIEREVYHNDRKAANARDLSIQIRRGIDHYGLVNLLDFGKVYAYEVDGRGHVNIMDDANVPSLLSIPYLGYLPATDPVYRNTRRFVLSTQNPYFYSGRYARGIGSPHTPPGFVWPLALIMQALTSTNGSEVQRVLGYILASDVGDHRLHESFDANRPTAFTRPDFAWPNALYAEFVDTQRERSQTAQRAHAAGHVTASTRCGKGQASC